MTTMDVRFAQGAAGPDPWPTADSYSTGEALASQSGAGAVLTFTFSSPMDLIWVMSIDLTDSDQISWMNPFGGTPSNGAGIPCLDRAQQPVTLTTSSVKVWAPTGTTVAVWGYRY